MAHVIILLVAWGALTFGAVYPWGYGPLAAASLIAGLAALIGCGRRRVPVALTATMMLLVVSILVQQMPMPRGVLERISPATVHLLAERDIAFGADVSAWHPLTIDPTRTWTGLFLVVSLAALWLGLSAAMTERLLFRIAGGIVTVGFGIAVIGIVGLANHTGKVLGFWQPLSHAAPFGPFVNRNHYAGWMLMTVPFGFGYLLSLLTRSAAVRPRSWRARVAWLSTRQANLTIMLALALTVMVLSVLASLSRSGILCLLVSLAAFGWYVTRKIARRRALAIACIIALAAGCVGWAGVDRIGSRFAEFGSNRSGGRFGIWHDTAAVARAFPVAGTGFDTFGVAMIAYQTTDPDQHYEEAHNDYLQVAAEGGLLVGIPALALLIVVARQVWQCFREQRDSRSVFWVRAGAVAGLLTIALQEATDFSLQMPGNAALFCVLAAIAVHRSAREPVSRTDAEFRGGVRKFAVVSGG